MKKRVLVLGAGFGGMELSTMLSDAFGDGVEVTLIDKSDSFYFGFSGSDVRARVKELLEMVDLPADFATRRPGEPASSCHRG